MYGLCFSFASAKEKRKQVGQKPHEELFPNLFLSISSHAHCDFLFLFHEYAKFILTQGPLQLFLQSEMFSCIFRYYLMHLAPSKFKRGASWLAQIVKNLPANARDVRNGGVRSLGQKDPLVEGAATHCSILAWRIPRTEKPGEIWSIGSQRLEQA